MANEVDIQSDTHKDRLQSGLEVLQAVFELSLVVIRENIRLLPNVKSNSATKNLTQIDIDTSKYLSKNCNANSSELTEFVNNVIDGDFYTKYAKFCRNSGISFEELLAKCFKVKKDCFGVKVSKKNIEIILNEKSDDFLIQNKDILEKKLSKINTEYEKNKAIVIKNRKMAKIHNDRLKNEATKQGVARIREKYSYARQNNIFS